MLSGKVVGVERICQEFSISRDAYYKYSKRYEKRMLAEDKVLNLVRERRKQ